MSRSLFISSLNGILRMAVKEDNTPVKWIVSLPWRRQPLGDIVSARVLDVDDGLHAAFVQVEPGKEGFLRQRDVIPKPSREEPVSKSVKPGQAVIVQIQKAPSPGKRIPCSMDLGLVGFHTVFFPFGANLRFSKRFSADKNKIKKTVGDIFTSSSGGWLFRSSSSQVSQEALRLDCQTLLDRWLKTKESFASSTSVRVLDSTDSDPLRRFMTDHLADQPDSIFLDDPEIAERVRSWAELFFPHLRASIHVHHGDHSMMATYGLDSNLSEMSRPRIWLKSGGYLVFNRTEALTVVDVNSGKANLKRGNVESLNCQAAKEVARQIQLRELGGIIVIDFLNMTDFKSNKKVEEAFRSALGNEMKHCRIEPINRLGILALSRKRKQFSPWQELTQNCPTCKGTGFVDNLDHVMINLLDEWNQLTESEPEGTVVVQMGKALFHWARSLKWESAPLEMDEVHLDPKLEPNSFHLSLSQNGSRV